MKTEKSFSFITTKGNLYSDKFDLDCHVYRYFVTSIVSLHKKLLKITEMIDMYCVCVLMFFFNITRLLCVSTTL